MLPIHFLFHFSDFLSIFATFHWQPSVTSVASTYHWLPSSFTSAKQFHYLISKRLIIMLASGKIILVLYWNRLNGNVNFFDSPNILGLVIQHRMYTLKPIISIFVLEKNVVGHWPWMASIGFVDNNIWKHQCGATLITRKHFLTAGHCAMKE